jgi:adenosylcobinamide-phosphate synthase
METALICIVAVLLDNCLGEPRRFHPLAGFGAVASGLERLVNFPRAPHWFAKFCGSAAVLLLLVPPMWLALWFTEEPIGNLLFGTMILYFCIGQRSLREHAEAVATALRDKDLEAAREAVERIVSRDTATLDESGACRAAIESVLENGNDAVFGALFWFAVAGAPGALTYRLANTLDAMWGYRNERYLHFGWAAARLDDVLNWIPARLTALSYALLGQTGLALRCWRKQAKTWKSPNAGPVMAAGAGALGVLLGGAACYHGHEQQRPPLGMGFLPRTVDIGRAVRLVRNGVWLWLATMVVISGAFYA